MRTRETICFNTGKRAYRYPICFRTAYRYDRKSAGLLAALSSSPAAVHLSDAGLAAMSAFEPVVVRSIIKKNSLPAIEHSNSR